MKNNKILFGIIALTLVAGLIFAGCSLNSVTIDSFSDVKIDYGKSELYSKEDMDAAIEIIKAEFSTWNGCSLQKIYYVSDNECSEQNINWLNEIEAANDNEEVFTQCIMFESDFNTAEQGDLSGFENGKEYKNWQWWLGRSETDDWKLMTWGY
jgi:D-alanyl-D-alanine carboxypeptidase